MIFPTVSISLPIYNGAAELEARLDNIAAQTFGGFRVLMLDAASDDGTENICRRRSAADARFLYRRDPNRSSYLKAVLENAYRCLDSEYMILTSHSQRWAPNYLEECLKALRDHPQAAGAYSWCQFLPTAAPWPAELPGGLLKDGDGLDHPDPVRRLESLIEGPDYYTPYFGLIRTAAYFQGALSPESMVQEHFALSHLLRDSPLVQIGQPLFFRRWQPGEASYLACQRLYVSGPPERTPYVSAQFDGYKVFFIHSLFYYFSFCQQAPSLGSGRKEEMARRLSGAFIRRYRKELEAEIDYNTGQVIRGWFHDWRAFLPECAANKFPRPPELPGEDGNPSPPRPALEMSVVREVNTALHRHLMFFPKHPRLYYALGLTCYRLGRRAEAIAALALELQNNPDYEPARQKLREWENAR